MLQVLPSCMQNREIHPLDPQPHRYCMLASTTSAPRITRCSLGLYWSRDLCSRETGWLIGWLGDVILSRSDSERQRNLMMQDQRPLPVYYSQMQNGSLWLPVLRWAGFTPWSPGASSTVLQQVLIKTPLHTDRCPAATVRDIMESQSAGWAFNFCPTWPNDWLSAGNWSNDYFNPLMLKSSSWNCCLHLRYFWHYLGN